MSAQCAQSRLVSLLAAVRPLVAMTHEEAAQKDHHGMHFMYCQADVLNPCWNNRAEDVPGRHWGGGEACPECKLRAAIAAAQETPALFASVSLGDKIASTAGGNQDRVEGAVVRLWPMRFQVEFPPIEGLMARHWCRTFRRQDGRSIGNSRHYSWAVAVTPNKILRSEKP